MHIGGYVTCGAVRVNIKLVIPDYQGGFMRGGLAWTVIDSRSYPIVHSCVLLRIDLTISHNLLGLLKLLSYEYLLLSKTLVHPIKCIAVHISSYIHICSI